MADGDASAGSARQTDLISLKPLLETVGVVAAQLSVLGSVLVYFGTVATRVEARFFGLDPSQLNYSNQELLTRSIAPMLGPLTIGGAVGVFILQLNALAAHRAAVIGGWRWTRVVIQTVTAIGLVLLAAGAIWQWQLGSRHSYWSPMFLGAGAALLLCARGTAAMVQHRQAAEAAGDGAHGEDAAGPVGQSPIRALDAHSKLVLGLVLVFALFGFTARLAQSDGFDRAVLMVSNLDERTTVSVLSEEPLILNRRGVACFAVTGSKFTRRYSGLHLIAFRDSRYYLVPSGFDVNNGLMIVLNDGPEIRVEYDATPLLRSVEGLPPRPAVTSPDPNLRC